MNKITAIKKQIFCVFLIVLGIGIFFVGVRPLKYKFNKKYVLTEAKVANILLPPDNDEEKDDYAKRRKKYINDGIIDKNATRALILEFTFNGKTHTKGIYYDDLDIGDATYIYVNKDNLDIHKSKGNLFGSYFLLVAGIIMQLTGIVGLSLNIKRTAKIKKIKKEGMKIKAKILHADLDEKETCFGRHPYILTCVYHEGKEDEKIYRSHGIYLRENGKNYLGKEVIVYLDRDGKYLIAEESVQD